MPERTKCRRCGSVLIWSAWGWRHHPGPGKRGCGKPDPISESAHDKREVDALREALKNA